jgi:acetyl-CoA acetyltransferase
METPVIVGYGLIKIGEHWNKDLISLAHEAASKAMSSCDVGDLDAIYIGNVLGDALGIQGNLGSYLADELGFPGVPSIRVDVGSASGGYAVAEASFAVSSGRYDVVLAGGVEKLSDALPNDLYELSSLELDMYLVNYTGVTVAGINGILARMYMDKYKIDKEKITSLAVLDHSNAKYSPHAQFTSPISIELAMSSPMLADPLNIFDSYAFGDGSAFVVITNKKYAMENGLEFVEIAGVGLSSNLFSISERNDPLWFDATEKAFKDALENAGIGVSDIDVAEIHDDYTISGILALESMGFSERGKAGLDVWNGKYSLDGEIPINTFGGLKARGNPFGATGVYQVSEIYMQLMGIAKENGVSDANIGLVHNMSSLDTSCAVLVFRR